MDNVVVLLWKFGIPTYCWLTSLFMTDVRCLLDPFTQSRITGWCIGFVSLFSVHQPPSVSAGLPKALCFFIIHLRVCVCPSLWCHLSDIFITHWLVTVFSLVLVEGRTAGSARHWNGWIQEVSVMQNSGLFCFLLFKGTYADNPDILSTVIYHRSVVIWRRYSNVS